MKWQLNPARRKHDIAACGIINPNIQEKHYLISMLEQSGIKLFQMSFSKNDITKFESHEI